MDKMLNKFLRAHFFFTFFELLQIKLEIAFSG